MYVKNTYGAEYSDRPREARPIEEKNSITLELHEER